MKKTIKSPNRIIYGFAVFIMKIFWHSVYKISIDKSAIKNLKPPYIVLANHICNLDFLIAGAAMYPVRMNYVVGALYFRMKMIAWLLRLMGCVSKEQFTPDMGAIKNMMRVIDMNGVLIIYPSGQSSFSGEATYIDANIATLVKKLGVPVVNLYTNGAHIAFPKWNMSRMRKSRVDVHVRPILSCDELSGMSCEQIYAKIKDELYFDDYEWQRIARVGAKRPRCAEGLQMLLFVCPKCHSEFTMKTEKNKLYCKHCGNAALMDKYGLLNPADNNSKIFDTPTSWNRWQFDRYRSEISRPGYSYSEPANLLKCNQSGRFVKVGEGIAAIDHQSLNFAGTLLGESVNWDMKNSLNAILPHERVTSFDFFHGGELYAIQPLNSASVFKFVALRELLHIWLKEEAVKAVG